MSKKLSRREAIVSIGATTAAAGLVSIPREGRANDAVTMKDQKARIIVVLPVSGNNPIVIAPLQAIAVNGSSLHVDVMNQGPGPNPADFRLEFRTRNASGAEVTSPLPGISLNTVSEDIKLLAVNNVWSKNFPFISAAIFPTYLLTIMVFEVLANGTELYRTESKTEIFWGKPAPSKAT